MALSNVSSVQESKSDEELDLNDFSDQEQDVKEDYKRLLQESFRMAKTSEKRALKLKAWKQTMPLCNYLGRLKI